MDEVLSPAPPAPLKTRVADASRRAYARTRERLHAYRHELVILAMIAVAGVIFMLPLIYHTIPAGHVGVLWKRFGGGTITEEIYPEGYRLTFPWDLLQVYDARLQTVEREVDVLSSDGLQIKLTLVWRFRILPPAAGHIHKFIGPRYADTLVAPTVGARARDVIAVYQPDEIYTDSRLKIQNHILEAVRYELSERFKRSELQNHSWLVLEDVLIKAMTLPPGVQAAIVRKNAMFQEMQEFTFRIKREEKEAERKRIEAVGIRNFQEIVSNGMTDPYLRWRGIEATLDLAKSANAKVVVVGNSKNGLPLILNTDAKDAPEAAAGGQPPARERRGAAEGADKPAK